MRYVEPKPGLILCRELRRGSFVSWLISRSAGNKSHLVDKSGEDKVCL